LVGGGLFGFVYAVARVVEPWPIKVVLDQVLYHKQAHGWWAPLFTMFGTSAGAILVACGLWLGLAGIVRGVSYYFEDYLLSTAAQRIVYAIRSRLYRHLHALPLSFHQRRRAGDTLVRLSADIILLRDVVVDALVNLASGGVMLVLMLAVMLQLDPVLTGVSLLVIPLVVAFTTLYGRRIRFNSRKQRKREGEVAAAMHEALSAMAVVQVHGAGEREQARFHDINRRSLKQGIKATRLEATMNRNIEIAIGAGLTAIVTVGTVRALHGSITPGDLVVFISYLRAAYRPLQRASKTVQRSAKALAAAERVVEVLEEEPEIVDLPDAEPAPPFTGHVELRSVEFAYTPGQPVLHNISLSAQAGRTTAIVGPTGCGKSTLLSLIPRLFEPSSGGLLIDGADIRTYTLDSLRAQVSVVLQESVLFGLSIADNIRYGAPDASDSEVVAAAKAAGIHTFIETLADGYDTVLYERGASLSGGQRQRIAIARALVRESPILLLDEPTSGLDAATQAEVVEALDALIEGRTTMLVTHDMRLIERSDHIVVLEDGRVVAEGAHRDLLLRSPQYRKLAGATPAPRRARPGRRASSRRSATRVMFYSHNGVGVGHVQRQLDLATAYRARHPDSSVLLATGSHGAPMFSLPKGVDYLKLPSLQMTDRYRNWRPRELSLPIETVTELRGELLRHTVRRFAPDLLVADFMPAGPYGELVPALDELNRHGGAAVAGFRDILDEPAYVRALWDETGIYDVLKRHYAAICVYGDSAAIDFLDGYGLDSELAARTRYCGYLGRPRSNEAPAERRPFILATSGGGVDGAATLESFISAGAALQPMLGGTWRVVSGPLMPARDHENLARLGALAGVEVIHAVPDLRRHVAVTDCIVTMCGYNTVCDVLSHQRSAVFVPRHGPSLEQTLRANRLAEWGSAIVVPERELDPGRLTTSIQAALASTPRAAPVSMNGFNQALDTFDTVTSHAQAA
jgi:ATP-binding cassette subfamily B protein